MARPKLTPMEFRRKYCTHRPRFAPEPESKSIAGHGVAVGTGTAQVTFTSKVA